MGNNSAQMVTGKAFEYAILKEFQEKLDEKTNVVVINNEPLKTAKSCFNEFDHQEQGRYLLIASFAVNFLMDIEPRLSNDIDKDDILQLEILIDYQGQLGDVRDILAIRLVQKWEIGVSAKNNHRAVKHSRLSNTIDFGAKWMGVKCSSTYFDEIGLIFSPLKDIQIKSNRTAKWSSLEDHHTTVYVPVLNAFKKELNRIYDTNPSYIASQLIEYLVGNKDFYKVIKGNNSVEIQAYNLHGTLNLPFQDILPKFNTPRINLPDKIIDISYKKNTKTTLIVEFNNDWKLSFRIHNASSRIEPSLKFDINLLSAPNSLFVNKLSVPQGV
ncbi:MAG: HaeIII family restriction endonuclease [Desulfobacterales bacterium]|nr:HaeIII family restriction endonuclease [Desulfobacterales bacterium]